MQHIRIAKIRPNGRSSCGRQYSMSVDLNIKDVSPDFDPDSSWHCLSAGNLKKMNKKRDPSKKHDVSAKVRMFLSIAQSQHRFEIKACATYLLESTSMPT